MTEVIGLAVAISIGFSLGMIGGGGSILTVPVLVYLLHINPILATAYSLFVVGLTSLIGAVSFMRKGLVDYRTAVVFALPSLLAVFLTRQFVVPAIPEEVFAWDAFILTKNMAVMLLFALVMLAAAFSMIRSGKEDQEADQPIQYNYPLIVLEGLVVGILTGLVGAGGGFLIIPALVLLAHLPMKMAVGTSLLIIAAKSLIGFLGDISRQAIDWPFLLLFSGFAIGGILLGSFFSRYVSAGKLKGGFGWFLLLMGTYILTKELFI
ncbi:MAG: sulfite exporter TauE/SafE family protein [Cyclobacteriaceae bacterium]